MRKLLFLLMVSISAMAEKPQEQRITEYLRVKDWVSANRELTEYIAENPDKAWAYSSRAWALENLKQYDEAIRVARQGFSKWGSDKKIAAALSRVLVKKAETLAPPEAHPLCQEAAKVEPREYTEFNLARSFRNIENFTEAIRLIEQGAQKYPGSGRFTEGLPYTRYLHFKSARAAKSDLKPHTESALRNLLEGTYNQYYPRLILRFGLRDIGNRVYFQSVYDKLLAQFPEDAWLHDDYGFQLYANYRIHDKADKNLKESAIAWRRKAYALYWKSRKLPKPVSGLGFPLKGRNIIWSEFGGSAMTHNGFSQYCYDFAAVDEQRNIAKLGSSRKNNDDYFMFGKPVYSVADGEVAGVIDGFADNPPGGFSGDANTITVRHKGYLSFYAHLKEKGIIIREGQKVKKGDLLGYVGNSGMSSESHLHFCINADNKDDITIPFQFVPATIESKDGKQLRGSGPYKEDDVVIFE